MFFPVPQYVAICVPFGGKKNAFFTCYKGYSFQKIASVTWVIVCRRHTIQFLVCNMSELFDKTKRSQ